MTRTCHRSRSPQSACIIPVFRVVQLPLSTLTRACSNTPEKATHRLGLSVPNAEAMSSACSSLPTSAHTSARRTLMTHHIGDRRFQNLSLGSSVFALR